MYIYMMVHHPLLHSSIEIHPTIRKLPIHLPMAESALLKIISEKLVKPSSPTPPSKYYKLSLIDAYFADKPGPMAFFYQKESFNGVKPCMELMETSLSKTLDYYHLFAGRLTEDKISIHCNDAGVQMWEVQIQASMSEILDSSADENIKNIVFPQGMYHFSCDSSRVMVQLNHFTCGGICVGICVSHELADAQMFFNFANDWATIARASQNIHFKLFSAPVFSETSIFPPLDHSPFQGTSSNTFKMEKVKIVTRRFVFSASSISKLKEMVTSDSEIENPSKVEVVTALIFKLAILASGKISGSFKPSSLSHVVNFRPLTRPPLSNHYVGNLVGGFRVSVTEEREVRLSRLVTELRKSKLQIQDAFRGIRPEGNELFPLLSRFWEELGKIRRNNNLEMYLFTSLCKLPCYEVDFGWGKPVFAFSCISQRTEKNILLIDTPNGDGIEAFITLEQDQMSIFQQDEELLAFATLNPSICVPT